MHTRIEIGGMTSLLGPRLNVICIFTPTFQTTRGYSKRRGRPGACIIWRVKCKHRLCEELPRLCSYWWWLSLTGEVLQRMVVVVWRRVCVWVVAMVLNGGEHFSTRIWYL